MMGRLSREYLAQIFALSVSLLDRVVVTGLLLRYWGVDVFASWALALSLAGMISLFDFGLPSYFPNRLLFAIEQKRMKDARHVLGAGNLLLILASGLGLLVIMLWNGLQPEGAASGGGVQKAEWLVLLLLGLATVLRQSMGAQLPLYRAHKDFLRETLVINTAELVRIALTVAAVAAGQSLTIVAGIYAMTTLLVIMVYPIWDTARRYPGLNYHVALPDAEERREAFRVSMLYWVQSSVNTAILYLPVILLAQFNATGAVVAQFALMRTLSNLVRTTIQMFANVFGLEAARRIARNDRPGLHIVYGDSSRVLAVQMGGIVGILAVAGHTLFAVWTGQSNLYDPIMFSLAVLPTLALPTMAILSQILVCSNMPKALAVGRAAQVGLTVAAFFLLPIESVGLRMMAALALGEVLGFAPPVITVARSLMPDASLIEHLGIMVRGAASGVLCAVATYAGLYWAPGTSLVVQLTCALLAGGLGLALSTWALGLSADRRTQLKTMVAARRSA